MTEKKEQILETALALFATQGFYATSTNKIAKKAGVSEGLIFKHFGNKKNLLTELMHDTQSKINELFSPILQETDAKEVLRKTINLPLTIKKEHYNYWKLQYKLRWEADYTNSNKFIPILTKLQKVFTTLGYQDPKNEAIQLNQITNSIAIDILLNRFEIDYIEFLTKKYKL